MSSVLVEFGQSIWIADGPILVAAVGFRYPTRMAVMKLDSGGLAIWSPVGLSESLRASVEALGRVRYLIAPNSLHHVFLGEWQEAYPDARVLAAPGLREKRPDIRFEGALGDDPVSEWEGQIDHVVMWGNRITSEVVFFHRASRTVLFTDLLQQFPPGWFSGWRALVARLDLMVGDEASVPRKFRLAFADRPAARAALDRILQWPAEKILMAHGRPVLADGRAVIARAFRWLR